MKGFDDRFADLASRHPNIRIVDWNAIVSSESGLVGDDGIHRTEWDELEVVRSHRSFLDAPGRFLRHLLD